MLVRAAAFVREALEACRFWVAAAAPPPPPLPLPLPLPQQPQPPPQDPGAIATARLLAHLDGMVPPPPLSSPFQLFVDVHLAMWEAKNMSAELLALPEAGRRLHFVKAWKGTGAEGRNPVIARFRSLRAGAGASEGAST